MTDNEITALWYSDAVRQRPIEFARALLAAPEAAEPVAQSWWCRNCNAATAHSMRGYDLCCDACDFITATRHTAPTDSQAGRDAVEATIATQLAEHVLHMEMVTARGKRARELARQVLAAESEALRYLRLIEHATAPTSNDGAYHENAHELALAGIAALAAAGRTPE